MLEELLQRLPQIMVPIAVVVGLQLLRRYCRPECLPTSTTEEPCSLENLDRQFQKTQWGVGLLYLVSAAVFAIGSWTLLRLGNEWLASLDGPATYRLYPSEAIWWFFPAFGALTIGWVMMELLLPFVLGRKTAQVYLYWTSARAGLNASKVFRWGAVTVAGPIGLFDHSCFTRSHQLPE